MTVDKSLLAGSTTMLVLKLLDAWLIRKKRRVS